MPYRHPWLAWWSTTGSGMAPAAVEISHEVLPPTLPDTLRVPYRRNFTEPCCGRTRTSGSYIFRKDPPYLNAIEECWHQGKRILLVSVYYRTFADMCNAIITYYRTVRFKLDIIRYASRNPKLFCKTYDRRYSMTNYAFLLPNLRCQNRSLPTSSGI